MPAYEDGVKYPIQVEYTKENGWWASFGKFRMIQPKSTRNSFPRTFTVIEPIADGEFKIRSSFENMCDAFHYMIEQR